MKLRRFTKIIRSLLFRKLLVVFLQVVCLAKKNASFLMIRLIVPDQETK